MASSIVTSFLSALQSSVSVLLQILYGVIATQFGLISDGPAKNVSVLCVKLFLPALLLTNIGSQLNAESGPRYLSVIVWAIFYNITSILLGTAVRRLFGMPRWVTPATTFNNTIAFPLILLQSLGTTGILDPLLWGANDTTSAALDRAKSYFLVNSMVSDTLTFGIGPKLLGVDEISGTVRESVLDGGFNSAVQGEENPEDEDGDVDPVRNAHRSLYDGEEAAVAETEETSLLPKKVAETTTKLTFRIPGDWFFAFISPPLIGAIVGIVIGLIPALQTAFFAEPSNGGIFKSWLTVSVKNIGELFASLQIVIVGVKLRASLRNMKKGEDSGPVPWGATVFVLFVRFILWPAISIPVIWQLASKTSVLDSDPMLWFSMMLMPTGPTALGLIALADVADDSEESKMSIAKFLVISYAISPVMTFIVVGALKASLASLSAS